MPTGLSAQPLDTLKAELLRENPELRALTLDYEAATKIAAQQNQLPDLEIGAGAFVLPVETRTGPQQFRLGVTQRFPWPGKLAGMAAVADARARPLLERVAARQLELFYRLERAYFSVAGLEARAAVWRERLGLYDRLDRLALSRLESGRGSSVEVYRLQLQRQRIERRLEELEYLSRQEEVTINQLLQRPPDSPVEVQLDLAARVEETLDFAPDLAADDPDLSRHPGLRLFVLQRTAHEAAIELSRLEQRPDFGLGVDYIATGQRTDLDPPRNGRDVIIPRIGLTVPLSRRKYAAQRQEEEIRLQALDARRESTENEFRAEIRRALNAIDYAANDLYYLNEQSRVVEAAMAIAETEYANGKRPFDELLRLEEELIEYRIEAVQRQTDILLERAVIDRYLVGPGQ